MNLDQIIEQILENELFLQLKNVVENIDGWHDHETVYDHSVKTANIAKEQIRAPFIINKEAKEEFLTFFGKDINGVKLRDIAILGALLHDCGKLLCFLEDGKKQTLITNFPNANGQTLCPGHEFYGGTIVVPAILKEIDIPEGVKQYIATIVRLHGTLNNVPYFDSRTSWKVEDLVSEVKTKAEGYHIEALFNAYCDCYTAPSFIKTKPLVEQIFNTPFLYQKREYFIPHE